MSSNWAINTLRRVAADLQRFSDGRRIDEDQLDAFSLSLHLAYRELAALECFNMLDSCGLLAMECVGRALENIEQMQEDDDEQVYRHPVIGEWQRGQFLKDLWNTSKCGRLAGAALRLCRQGTWSHSWGRRWS